MITVSLHGQYEAILQGDTNVALLDGFHSIAKNEIHLLRCECAEYHAERFLSIVDLKKLSAFEAVQEVGLTVDQVVRWIPECGRREYDLKNRTVTLVAFETLPSMYQSYFTGTGVSRKIQVAWAFLCEKEESNQEEIPQPEED